ncbi:hypothetical protein TRAPUB_8651 [Trametes pubescens]|uniref:Prolyl 4-hydroxylase alpha subunit Fe(2+) 2OG dioxygenase domain-containing protein n=1 Tax=Trametes pubescens TaxID=154538 RepID=A0A1M2W4L2_TRAPU|nr:hypothetical protein TRAPUB_8651 [Trametes pubescens]
MPSDTTIPDAARRLRAILTDNVPYCSGTLVGQPRDFLLYYGKAEQVGRIDLANPTVDELDRLAEACQPASFGVNQQDVFDESYRKAGKLDLDSFVLAFNADTHTGLLDAVRSGLFPGTDDREIRVELYKLNVYGENAFFKSHKDTPRAENMFGSLVIVFPTPHVGGALILRHDGREWVFDSGKLLSDPSLPPRIAYAAFFSDVDHEVTLVESGHRVSATYNLYFCPSEHSPASAATDSPTALRVFHPIGENPSEVSSALQELLAEPTFLPNGGTLGFGLRHLYPFPKTWSHGDVEPLTSLKAWLKGSDSALLHACHVQGLHPALQLLHEEEWGDRRGLRPTLFDQMPVVDSAGDGE